MGKQTKRERKFNTSGGVKGRLQKGTITKKGKLKGKKPRSNKDENDDHQSKRKANNKEYSEELRQKREDEDFTSKKNLGELDMESFFTTFEDEDEEEDVKMDDDDVQEDSGDDSSSDDDEEVASDDDSESNSDNEDLEAAEQKMLDQLKKLKEKDPEFHRFLEENDDQLLEYQAGGGEEDGDDDESEDDEEEEKQPAKMDDEDEEEEQERPVDGNTVKLTPAMLQKLEKATFKAHGIKSLKKFVNAFKSACHLTDGDNSEEKKERGRKYHFESSDVFDRLMVISFTRLPQEFHYHLLGKGASSAAPLRKKKDKVATTSSEDKEGAASIATAEELDVNTGINPKTLEKSRKWVDVKPILLSFFKSSNHLLSEAKEPDLVVFVLKSLADFIPYMSPFPQIADKMLKTLITLWSAPIDTSEDYQVVRLHSFLRIRQLALTQPFPFIEECLKKAYLAYAQRAKFANASSVTSSLPTLTFMGNCVVELYSLDYHSSYQHAFVYIRQMALHLRTAMQKKTPEALGAVYCWQYLHCLKLWVAVLTEACRDNSDNSNLGSGEDQMLRSLIFPLTQVILGTARLVPSARYLPLRLHCVRLLQQLAAASEIFLPTTSILLDVFDMRELSLSPKKVSKSNVQPMALTFRLRADNPLRTMEELEMCISEVFVLLNREVDLYRFSAGFPEFSVRICQRLRKVGFSLLL